MDSYKIWSPFTRFLHFVKCFMDYDLRIMVCCRMLSVLWSFLWQNNISFNGHYHLCLFVLDPAHFWVASTISLSVYPHTDFVQIYVSASLWCPPTSEWLCWRAMLWWTPCATVDATFTVPLAPLRVYIFTDICCLLFYYFLSQGLSFYSFLFKLVGTHTISLWVWFAFPNDDYLYVYLCVHWSFPYLWRTFSPSFVSF